MAAGENKLESIVTDVVMKADQFMDVSQKVMDRFTAMMRSVNFAAGEIERSMGKAATAFEGAAEKIAGSVTAVKNAVAGMGATFVGIPNAAKEAAAATGGALTGLPAAVEATSKGIAGGVAEIGTVLGGIVTSAEFTAGELNGVLTTMSESLATFSAAATKMSAEVQGALGGVAASVGEVNKSTVGLRTTAESLSRFTSSLSKLGDREASIANAVRLLGELKVVAGNMAGMTDSMGAFTQNMGSLSTSLSNFVKNAQGLSAAANATEKLKGALTGFENPTTAIKGTGDAIGAMVTGLAGLPDAIKGLDKGRLARIGKIGESLETIGKQAASLENSKDRFKEIGEALTAMSGRSVSIDKLSKSLKGFATGFKGMGDLVDASGQAATNINSLVGLITPLSNLSAPIESMKMSLGGLPEFLNKLDTTKLVGVVEPVDRMSRSLNALIPVSSTLPELARGLGLLADAGTKLGSTSLANIGKFIEGISLIDEAKLKALPQQLSTFAGAFKGAATDLAKPEIVDASKSLSRLGNFLEAANAYKFDPQKFTALTSTLQTTFGTLSSLVHDNASLGDVMKTVDKLGQFMRSTAKLDTGKVGDLVDPITKLFGGLTGVVKGSTPDQMEALYKMVGRTNTFLGRVNAVNPANLGAIAKPVGDFFGEIAKVDPTSALPVISGMNRYIGALTRMSAIKVGDLAASVAPVKALFAQLATIPITPHTNAVIGAMNRVGRAMRNITPPTGGGGGFGGMNINLTGGGGLGGIPPAARGASSAVGGFTNSLRGMFEMSGIATTGLTTLKYGLMGLSALGLGMFAKEDDALTRTLAHMGDYSQSQRPVLQSGINDVVSRSTTGATGLAKALDTLTASGMSAGMAVKALGIAETFSVASAIPMEKATHRLVEIMNGMGLAVEDVSQHYENIKRLSDLVVGTAAQAGSTDEQFTDAFTGRFMQASKFAKLGLEESAAMLAIYSKASIKGSAAGDMGAVGILGLERAMVQGTVFADKMKEMTGVSKMPILDVITKMAEMTAGMGSVQKMAHLEGLGLNTKTTAALLPLLENSNNVKEMVERMRELVGTTEAVAEMIRKSLLGQLKNLWNNASLAAMVFGENLAPALLVVTDALGNMFKAFTAMHPAFQQLIVFGGLGYLALPYLASGIMKVGVSLATIALGPVIMLTRGFMFLVGIPGMIVSGLGTVMGVLGSIVSTIISIPGTVVGAFKSVWGVISSAGEKVAMVFWTPLDWFGKGVIKLGEGLDFVYSLTKNIGKAFATIGQALLQMVASALSGLVSFAASILMWAVIAVPLITLFASAFAGIAAVAITVGMGLKSLFLVALDGVNSLWDGFKTAAANAFDWAADRAGAMQSKIVEAWGTLARGLKATFEGALVAFEKLAGFFWNFKHNMREIIDWMQVNWRQAFRDIGSISAAVIENIGRNLRVFGTFAYETLTETFFFAWKVISGYVGIPFKFIADQWGNMLEDMGMLLNAFFKSIAHNFGQLSGLFGGIARSVAHEMLIASAVMITDEGKAEQATKIQKIQKDREAMVKKHTDAMEFKGPAEFLKKQKWTRENAAGELEDYYTNDFKTDFTGLTSLMSQTNSMVVRESAKFYKQIGLYFLDMMEGMVPLDQGVLKNVLAPWKTLFDALKLDIVPDDVKKAIESYKQMFNPVVAGDDMATNKTSQAPGFNFKQISLERTMLGGPVAEALDYQQLVVMQGIHKTAQQILEQLGGRSSETSPPRPGFTNIYENAGMVE